MDDNTRKIEHRLSTLEANYTNIQEGISNININLTNHITETYKRISSMEQSITAMNINNAKKPSWLIVGVFSTMSSLIAGLIMYLLSNV